MSVDEQVVVRRALALQARLLDKAGDHTRAAEIRSREPLPVAVEVEMPTEVERVIEDVRAAAGTEGEYVVFEAKKGVGWIVRKGPGWTLQVSEATPHSKQHDRKLAEQSYGLRGGVEATAEDLGKALKNSGLTKGVSKPTRAKG